MTSTWLLSIALPEPLQRTPRHAQKNDVLLDIIGTTVGFRSYKWDRGTVPQTSLRSTILCKEATNVGNVLHTISISTKSNAQDDT